MRLNHRSAYLAPKKRRVPPCVNGINKEKRALNASFRQGIAD